MNYNEIKIMEVIDGGQNITRKMRKGDGYVSQKELQGKDDRIYFK